MSEGDLLAAQLSPLYNCAHFVADAWERETGHDIRPILVGFLTSPDKRRAEARARHSLVRIPAPVSPCLVLFRRAKTVPHAGLYVRGRVLHLADTGPIRQLLSVASIGYTSVRFYAPR